MRSIKLLTSTDSETEDERLAHDEICHICKEWCLNARDFEVNFVSCSSCHHSYHKECISVIYHSADRHLKCDQLRNKSRNKRLRCNRSSVCVPKLLFEILSYEFAKMSYFYQPNGDPLYYYFARETCNLYNANIFTRTQCRSIKWKANAYHIGDSIEINHNNTMRVAMIKKIYIYSEPFRSPTFCIFWYRKQCETNCDKYNNNKDRKEGEIYLDIESGEDDNEICIDSVSHKVLLCDDIDSFEESKSCNFKEFGAVYFCRYSFTIENYTKYDESPFEKINIGEIKNKINILSRELENKYNAKMKRKAKSKNSIEKVRKYLNVYDTKYVHGEDEYPCFDANVPFSHVMKQKSVQQKVVKCSKSMSDEDKMQEICQMLRITKGVHTNINLYGFKEHLDVYEQLLSLMKINDEKQRNAKILNMNTSHLRDIKSKIQSEGKTGKKQEMVLGINKKLKEFKINYDAYKNKKEDNELLLVNMKRKRKRKSLFDHSLNHDNNNNNNNTNRKKRRLS